MTSLISGQRLPWKRFWAPWDEKVRFSSDGRGFLENPDSLWGKISKSKARLIDELLAARCVILSGPPGMGKTVEIEQAHNRLLKDQETSKEVFLFHCRAIASTEMLRAETVAHPRWGRARAAKQNISLIIDGVDEGLRKVPEFVAALTQILGDEAFDQLQVILVCRSAEWDVTAGRRLMQLWPEKERGGVFELCPLRHQDAEPAHRITVIVEVKRCCHPDIAHACETQLANGYLADQGLTHGIYLVGWFGSRQGETAKWKTKEIAQTCVENWAKASSKGDVSVAGFLLDCRMPDPTGPTKRTKIRRKRPLI